MRLNKMFLEVGVAISVLLSGCAASGVKSEVLDKQVLDTGAGSSMPAWVKDTKTSWTENGSTHKFKAFYSIRGDERLTACYELAKLNARETITTEIWSDFKAAVSHSTQGLSESVEDIFIQSRNIETKGNIRGLRFSEAFHQRYLVNGVERIDCYVLGELADNDYKKMRAQLLNPVVQANPELRKAVEENHMDLFRNAESKVPEKRELSSDSSNQSKMNEMNGSPRVTNVGE